MHISILLRNRRIHHLTNIIDGPDKSMGIIVAVLALNYLLENFPDRNIPYPVLKIGQYPMPRKLFEKLIAECERSWSLKTVIR